jgi:hypothetical protein
MNKFIHVAIAAASAAIVWTPAANAQPRAGEFVQQDPDLRVNSIALGYAVVPGKTKPGPTTECRQARLTVTLRTTKAGSVNFRLHQKFGTGPAQARNVRAHANFDDGHYVASYQEIVSVDKTMNVRAMAEEFNSPPGQTTGWKDVTLRCENTNGGYAGTPGNSSPDNANFPRQPKHVFEGQNGLATTPGGPVNPDGRNAPQPFRPVIAPAAPKKPVQIKTAPVRQRDSRFIGIGVQRVQ